MMSSNTIIKTDFVISAGVPNQQSGTMVDIIILRCSPDSEEASRSLSPGGVDGACDHRVDANVTILKSVVQVRANERTAAFVALSAPLFACSNPVRPGPLTPPFF